MTSYVFGIDHFEVVGFLSLLVFFCLLEIATGILSTTRRSRDDWWLEVFSFVVPPAVIKPLVAFVAFALCLLLVPSLQGHFEKGSLWVLLPFYLLIDDFAQYWYHRTAHEVPWLWKLHRPHHTARELGLLATFRNGLFYYVFLPNLWLIGIGSFLGAINAVALGIVIKQVFVISSHSPTRWDQYLYRSHALGPLAWLVERVFITPAVHQAHHGRSIKDGISNPNGNYGNMFFFWDRLFGTALITRQYPAAFGLPHDPGDPWWAQFFYPILKSDRPGSEISRGYQKRKTTSLQPWEGTLEPGAYLWCRCGYSRKQPFCDGSHHGTRSRPLPFELQRPKQVRLCNCKETACGPFCDLSHEKIINAAERPAGAENVVKVEVENGYQDL